MGRRAAYALPPRWLGSPARDGSREPWSRAAFPQTPARGLRGLVQALPRRVARSVSRTTEFLTFSGKGYALVDKWSLGAQFNL